MGFTERAKLHNTICDWLINYLNFRGFPTIPYGFEHSEAKDLHPHLRYRYNDKTARFIKHQPDIICIQNNTTWLIEVKTLGRYDTPNFAIEMDSYNTLMDLYKIGCKVLVIFNTIKKYPYGLVCIPVENIEIDSIRKWDEAKNDDGSGTSYGLIRKKQKGFISSIQFLNNLLSFV